MRRLARAVSAGILIAIGGCVFLSCESRYVGAVLFSVALLGICCKGYALFTGKVGYLVTDHSPDALADLSLALLGNALATFSLGWAVGEAMPNLRQAACTICAAKLTQLPASTLLRAALCGVLMYLAVSIYREKATIAGIVFCVPVFILSGFEHSIANMFYFAAAGGLSLRVLGYLCLVILGNALGGCALPLLDKLGTEKETSHV